MISAFARLPIYRRLFICFLLAAIVPDAAIATIAIQTLNAHGISSAGTIPLLVAVVIAILISTVMVVIFAYVMNLTIVQPLNKMVFLTKRISRGETKARVEVEGRDEISTVATAMNTMLDNIVKLLDQVGTQRDMLQSQVEKLVNEVSSVGEGDLRIQADVTSESLGVLADSFNYMVETLSNLIIRVKMVSMRVEGSTMNTFHQMIRVVENADTQIQQIALATENVRQMANFSRAVAQQAQVMDDAAREVQRSAQLGRATVSQVSQRMSTIVENAQATSENVQALGERSLQINDIVEIIKGIAFQTNRLALDATIQAAMAGENGKGFAAVADAIRRLSENAKQQTTSIAGILLNIREIGGTTSHLGRSV
ncbi:MAG TPA: methyl-accepting chemotaxis protein [Ktedonobacteraceae bacterium]|nr:methyl-accepting chemotaxis protein [Ktedonobacteraceae bacterium]